MDVHLLVIVAVYCNYILCCYEICCDYLCSFYVFGRKCFIFESGLNVVKT